MTDNIDKLNHGRKMNAAEVADADAIIHQYVDIRDNLNREGRKDEAIVLDQRVLDLCAEWQKKVSSMPEGSETVLFSDCLVETLAPYRNCI
jgi:hypothetical protein